MRILFWDCTCTSLSRRLILHVYRTCMYQVTYVGMSFWRYLGQMWSNKAFVLACRSRTCFWLHLPMQLGEPKLCGMQATSYRIVQAYDHRTTYVHVYCLAYGWSSILWWTHAQSAIRWWHLDAWFSSASMCAQKKLPLASQAYPQLNHSNENGYQNEFMNSYSTYPQHTRCLNRAARLVKSFLPKPLPLTYKLVTSSVRGGGGDRREVRVRVGWVSSNIGDHSLSHLMRSVFGMHGTFATLFTLLLFDNWATNSFGCVCVCVFFLTQAKQVSLIWTSLESETSMMFWCMYLFTFSDALFLIWDAIIMVCRPIDWSVGLCTECWRWPRYLLVQMYFDM